MFTNTKQQKVARWVLSLVAMFSLIVPSLVPVAVLAQDVLNSEPSTEPAPAEPSGDETPVDTDLPLDTKLEAPVTPEVPTEDPNAGNITPEDPAVLIIPAVDEPKTLESAPAALEEVKENTDTVYSDEGEEVTEEYELLTGFDSNDVDASFAAFTSFAVFAVPERLQISLECPAEDAETLAWHVYNPNATSEDFVWNNFFLSVEADTVAGNSTTTIEVPFYDDTELNRFRITWLEGWSIKSELKTYEDAIEDCFEITDEVAPSVSIGLGNGNTPDNTGPVHEQVVNGTVPVFATVEDENSFGYHFRIIKQGGEHGHSCGDALGDLSNEGFGGCGYVYNLVRADQSSFSDTEIASIDTTSLEDGTYVFILGAADEAGNRTQPSHDYMNDPQVVVVVNNAPKVSIGNSNDPINIGPVDGSPVSGVIPVYATVQDGDLAGYHFRIVPAGTDSGAVCGGSLIDPSEQGYNKCGYAFNQGVLTSTAFTNEKIADIDTTQLADGSYDLVIGAVDSLNQRTAADHHNDPKVTIVVSNEAEIDYPYGEIVLPTASSTATSSVTLEANYYDGDAVNDDAVQWAVRQGASCNGAANTRFGNVDGKTSTSSWDGSHFMATIDVSSSATGTYCFIFNPTDDAGETDVRLTRLFDVASSTSNGGGNGDEETPTDTVITIRPSDMLGAVDDWFFQQETGTGTAAMVEGPAGALLFGEGSARLTETGASSGGRLGLYTDYANVALSDITELSYQTYQTSGNNIQAIALQFDIDANLTGAWQGRLIYEPYHTKAVTTGEWQSWDVDDDFGTGNWWFSGAPGNTECPQSNPCTWTEVKTKFPGIKIRSTGGISFKAGSGAGWDGFDGNIDKFVIKVGDDRVTYDFEPEATDDGGDNGGDDDTDNNDNDNNGSSSSSRSSSRRSGGSSNSGDGEVLGATFCPAYLNQYMGLGRNNVSEEVVKLQQFLNDNEGANIEVTGVYDQATYDAVKTFQEKYSEEILKPWYDIGQLPNASEGTGYAYKMTIWWINVLHCSDTELASPILP